MMMKCGHSANATKNGKPACVICMGKPEAEQEAVAPDLTGRVAKCGYCSNKQESRIGMAFFEYRPEEETDRFYCGCGGWD